VGKVSIGLVGFGYWGPNLARNLAANTRIDFRAMCDNSSENRNRFAKSYPDVEVCEDLSEFENDESLDAVVIATPAPTHHQLALRCLKAGKHCFVEKPLTLRSDHARELIDFAEEKELILQVGHLMEYHSAINWIKEYISSGELGEVLYLYMQRLNLGKVRAEENAFWSLAPHDVSIALYLLDETPSRVAAHGADYINKCVEDVVFANLHFDSGKIVNIHVSWLDPHKTRKLTIVGTKKMLVFDDMQPSEKIWIYDKGVSVPEVSPGYSSASLSLRFGSIESPFVPLQEPLALEIDHFVDCCLTGNQPVSDGRDGLRVVQVLEAAEASVKQDGIPVSIGAKA
jgi:predicted dehydrogenase